MLVKRVCPILCGTCNDEGTTLSPRGGSNNDGDNVESTAVIAVGFSVWYRDSTCGESNEGGAVLKNQENLIIEAVILAAGRLIKIRTPYWMGPPLGVGGWGGEDGARRNREQWSRWETVAPECL